MASPKLRWSSIINVSLYLSVLTFAQPKIPSQLSHIHQFDALSLKSAIRESAPQNAELLEPNKPVQQELAGGNTHAYRLQLAAGQYVDLVADQRGIDVVLVLFAPDGNKLLEVDSPNGSRGPEPLSFIADTSGDYKIEVRSLEKKAAAGRYEIKINELRPVQPDDQTFVAAKKLAAEGLNFANERKPESRAKAIEKYVEATRLFRLMEDKKRKASGIQQIGGLYRSIGKSADAINFFKEAGLLFEEAGLKRDAAVVFLDAGNLPESYGEAQQYYEKSLALAEAVGDKELVARLLVNIGTAYREQGKREQALDFLNRGLSLARELNNKQIEASALTNIGTFYSLQGRGLEAIENYQKSYALHEAMGNKAAMASQLINMGSARAMLGNMVDALASFEKALALNETLGNKRGATVVLYNIGNVYKALGNNIRAMEYYQKSLALGNTAGALINLADLYSTQGSYAQALRHSQKALDLFLEGNSAYGTVVALNTIGQVYESQGNTSEALVNYQKALTRSESAGLKNEIVSGLSHLGNVYLTQHNYSQALDHFQRALQVSAGTDNKDSLAGVALKGIAKTYLAQHNYSLALEFANRAAGVSQASDWESNSIAARAHRGLNQPDKARQKYEAAIASIELLRSQVAGGEQERQRFMEGKVLPYQEMIELLVSQGKTEEALAYAERSKGRVLLDVLSNGRFSVSKSMTAEERTEERRLDDNLVSLNSQIIRESQRPQVDQKRLADLRSNLDRARLDYEAFRIKLYAAHPDLKVQRGELQPFSLHQALSLLPNERSALLEYVVTQDRVYLFLLTKGAPGKASQPGLKVYTIQVNQKNLEERVASYRQKIANTDLDFRAPGRELYDLLLKPAQDQIRNKTSLVIVPDGVLWELPFQALQSASGRYLIQDKAISYSPSVTIMREVSRSRRKPDSGAELALLGFGNPTVGLQSQQRVKAVFMDETLDPLPEAEKQVKALAELYGASQSKVYTGADAREERAKLEASGYGILHFATHGILDSTSPMYSHLVLSQNADDSREDGLLEAWEVMDLNLKADMVVLAACETARGRLGAGEGMIGMSWAFFVAGSPTTVASQWKVESASTTQLMLEFHRNLRANRRIGRTSKAKALQLAALKLLKNPEYQHPFYWAGFVLLGDGSTGH
jgi:CHAT domain-containing protein